MNSQLKKFATEEVYRRISIITSNKRKNAVGYISIATGDIVQEAFARLVNSEKLEIQDESHLMVLLAKAVRYVLLDYHKSNHRQRRNGVQLTITHADRERSASPLDFIKLHEAVLRLEAIDPTRAQIVELRYFGGFTLAETADTLEMSEASVKRSWQIARAWLWEAFENERRLQDL